MSDMDMDFLEIYADTAMSIEVRVKGLPVSTLALEGGEWRLWRDAVDATYIGQGRIGWIKALSRALEKLDRERLTGMPLKARSANP